MPTISIGVSALPLNAVFCHMYMLPSRKRGELAKHYSRFFGPSHNIYYPQEGPVGEIGKNFQILEFPSTKTRSSWIYCTSGMSQTGDVPSVELFLMAPVQDHQNIVILTAVAHFHRTAAKLNWGHTVNFGIFWGGAKSCDCGLISLPYPFGPKLENLKTVDGEIRILWLLPITKAEREYKMKFGIEELEKKLEDSKFRFLDQARKSVV